ncbi:MAG: hypothetical protein EXR66_02295 [Dehalococcoidia bacterium]|nr:hypothetical protein [Dehalococcoidia bacterium]
MTSEHATEYHSAFEARLRDWLRTDAGVTDWRRLSRLDEDTALVSKFEEGFAPRLHALLDALPDILDEGAVLAAYASAASGSPAGTSRVEAWDHALRGLLRDACARLGITEVDDQQAFVRVGVDSVRAILESILWTAPAIDEPYAPADGERAAYLDVVRAFAGRDFFTRTYGQFDDRLVQNHCPGAAYARVMLVQAWRVCTETEPPTADT